MLTVTVFIFRERRKLINAIQKKKQIVSYAQTKINIYVKFTLGYREN